MNIDGCFLGISGFGAMLSSEQGRTKAMDRPIGNVEKFKEADNYVMNRGIIWNNVVLITQDSVKCATLWTIE